MSRVNSDNNLARLSAKPRARPLRASLNYVFNNMTLKLQEQIHLKDYLTVIKNRKWIVIGVFIITVSIITFASFVQKPIYRSTATVIVDIESPNVLSVKDVVTLGEPNYFAYKEYLETQLEIIKSRRVAHYVFKNLNLAGLEEFLEAKDPIKTLLKKIKVELVRDTRVIKISADDQDKLLAQNLANEFAKVYAESNLAFRAGLSEEAKRFLQTEVDRQKEKVKESELALQRYKEENDIISAEEKENLIAESLKKLNTSLVEAQTRRIQAEIVYKNFIERGKIDDLEKLPQVLSDNKTLVDLKDSFLKLESELVEAKKIYKTKHPKMERLLAEIEHLKARVKDEVEQWYKACKSEEASFKETLEEKKKEALDLERKIIELNAIAREVETNKRMLELVLNRMKETSVASQIQTNNIRIQDLAEEPKVPVKPRKRLNIALSIIIGFLGGIGMAFFTEYLDTTLKSPKEISELVGLPLLGCVPKIEVDGKRVKKKDIDRIVERDSASLASEAYRTIRTNLQFHLGDESGLRTLIITSPAPKEGKTITACNLAISIANSGQSVLLVDSDLRKGRLHSIFEKDNTLGLADFLSREVSLESVLLKTGIENLFIVTSGQALERPAELITSPKMKTFIKDASIKFKKVIFDTPPVIPVTDAAILASLISGTILVIESGKSTRPLLLDAKSLLEKVSAKPLGIVVNNISLTRGGDYYPYYYKYYRKK